MKEVIVVNKNPKTFKDGYNGIVYEFETGKKVPIPVAAAVHIFGFNQEEKAQRNRRSGFMDTLAAEAFFGNFTIEFVEYVRKDETEANEDMALLLAEKDAKILEQEETIAAQATQIEQLTAQLEEAQAEPTEKKNKKKK